MAIGSISLATFESFEGSLLKASVYSSEIRRNCWITRTVSSYHCNWRSNPRSSLVFSRAYRTPSFPPNQALAPATRRLITTCRISSCMFPSLTFLLGVHSTGRTADKGEGRIPEEHLD